MSRRNLVLQTAGVDTMIPAISGDAVRDCAAQWQRETGTTPPQLLAYDNGNGGIMVLPADQTPPSGATPLPVGNTQSVPLIDLQESLDDYVTGLNSGCYDNTTATSIAQQDLTELGLSDWTVISAPATDAAAAPAGGTPVAVAGAGAASSHSSASNTSQQCVDTAILDPAAKTVSFGPLGGPADPQAIYEKLADKLRLINGGCASLDATAQQVRAAAADLGLSEAAHDYQLTEIAQASASCTTIHETVGGTIFLILRGPN